MPCANPLREYREIGVGSRYICAKFRVALFSQVFEFIVFHFGGIFFAYNYRESRFQRLAAPPPTPERTIRMLHGLRTRIAGMRTRLLVAAFTLAFAVPAAGDLHAVTITVQGNTTAVGNCIPFGCPGSFDPVMGFVYKNIPAFTVNAGDTIAFDTGGLNDFALTFNIYLGAMSANGSTTLGGGGLSLIVANGTPTNPLGNAVVGDFDLAYTITNAFTFAGGGLAIAFETIGTSTLDVTNNSNLVQSNAVDTSGFFVSRFFGESGVPLAGAVLNDSASIIGHFQIVAQDPVPEPATLALVGLGLAGLGIAARMRRRR
jgi:hypothetical protein